jgi:hypothetical protein
MQLERNESSQIPVEETSQKEEFDALGAVINALQPLSSEARRRILDTATTFLRVSSSRSSVGQSAPPTQKEVSAATPYPPFSQETLLSPKEFMLEKQPRTDMERIACLAYYLTHYREMPHFKTLDLSKLNTEAAQPKFSNAAYSSNNAVKKGFLIPTTKGQRQLSAQGERFVEALPDRDAARQVLEAMRVRRRKPRSAPSSSKSASSRDGA